MKIRRKSEKSGPSSVDGVPPLHTLITCTYQKLFKKEGLLLAGDRNGSANGAANASSDPKSHRHERGSSWRVVVPEAKVEEETTPVGGAVEAGGPRLHGDGHDSPAHPEDLHTTKPLLPKRRKVKSTRYAVPEISAEDLVIATPHRTKAGKRSRKRNIAGEDTPDYNPSPNAKEALIASIFYVFDSLGKSGLTASEVVASMLEQKLPGLKEGGARHTVQVANVLRRSRHFIPIGNKQYLPCSVGEDPVRRLGRQAQAIKSRSGRPLCKLYDGNGWFCPREAHAGFSLCPYHLDMIHRPFGSMPAAPSSSSIPDSPVLSLPNSSPSSPPSSPPSSSPSSSPSSLPSSLPSQQESDPYSDTERDDSDDDDDDDEDDDNGPALAKWGRDRAPGSVPVQKRKMLSLCSIK